MGLGKEWERCLTILVLPVDPHPLPGVIEFTDGEASGSLENMA